MEVKSLFLILFMITFSKISANLNLMKLHLKQANETFLVDPKEINDYFNIFGTCSKEICNGPSGYCYNANQCKCLRGYANVPNLNSDSKQRLCNYQQHKQIKAFLLEFFLMCGFGHLSVGRLLNGMLKLLFFISICIVYILLKFSLTEIGNEKNMLLENKKGRLKEGYLESQESVEEENTGKEKIYGALFCGMCCGLVIWQLVDVIIFGLNKYNDGMNVPLLPW